MDTNAGESRQTSVGSNSEIGWSSLCVPWLSGHRADDSDNFTPASEPIDPINRGFACADHECVTHLEISIYNLIKMFIYEDAHVYKK